MPRASPEPDSPPASPPWRLLLAHTSCPLLGEVTAEAASLENKKPWLLPCPWHQIRRLRDCSPFGEAASLSPSLHIKWTVLLLLVSPTRERVRGGSAFCSAGRSQRWDLNPALSPRSFPTWLSRCLWVTTPSLAGLPPKASVVPSPPAGQRPWERLQGSREAWRGWVGMSVIPSLEAWKLRSQAREPAACLTKRTSNHLPSEPQVAQKVSLA